jgi:hypothetical protein
LKRKLLIAICTVIACSLIAIPILLTLSNPTSKLDNAIQKAINYFQDFHEPYGLLMPNVMYRRFGIQEFADSLQRYDQEMLNLTYAETILRVFRRIADHDNQLQPGDMEAVAYDADKLTVAALYCDRYELPANYTDMFETAVLHGGSFLTHALLASIWIQENDCTLPFSQSYIDAIYEDNAALINNDAVVDDVELESAAFLYIAGQGSLVNQHFKDRVLAVQNEDGGWFFSSDDPDDTSYWHSTVLALMFLRHLKYPSNAYPPMLAPAQP